MWSLNLLFQGTLTMQFGTYTSGWLFSNNLTNERTAYGECTCHGIQRTGMPLFLKECAIRFWLATKRHHMHIHVNNSCLAKAAKCAASWKRLRHPVVRHTWQSNFHAVSSVLTQ
jgi:hypothetical protein